MNHGQWTMDTFLFKDQTGLKLKMKFMGALITCAKKAGRIKCSDTNINEKSND